MDDEWSIRDILSTILVAEGFEVDCAEDGAVGIQKLDESNYDLVVTDLNMPHISGIEVLKHIQSKGSATLGIVATGYGSIETAVEALKAGAFDYITKPFHLEEIKILVRKAREYQKLRSENVTLRRQLEVGQPLNLPLGDSPAMVSLNQMIRTVAMSDATVLILGESGTGKELVARAIHLLSPRSEGPMIPVNCAAIPEELLESELFGHVRGAFTGAVRDRMGRFQLADGGTIFLDEIGDMSPKLQVKLLRVLEDQQVEPVGSTKSIGVNVRILTATNQDLEQNVEHGTFRKDLFYRLNVIPIRVPPLRERREDVPLLAAYFAERFARTGKRALIRFTAAAMASLCAYSWPGNVRELEHLVERLGILHAGEEIDVGHLPEKILGERTIMAPEVVLDFPDEGIELNRLVDQYETALIAEALRKTGGRKSKAAALLRIKRTTLVERMKKKGMMEEDHA